MRLLWKSSAWLMAAAALTGCWNEDPHLPDTLYFPPGTTVQYLGHVAKLYGHAQCAQGQLTGHTCLIFPPHSPRADALIVGADQAWEVQLTARQDPANPLEFVITDKAGREVLRTNGRHDEVGNIDIRPDGPY